MPNLLVFDFDGVISDSAAEAYLVARRTYLALWPDAPLRERDGDEVERRFVEAMPLGNRAEDFGAVLAAIERDAPLDDQAGYDAVRAGLGQAWLDTFHRRFYETRRAVEAEDREAWLALMRPYPRFVEILRRRSADRDYAIATAKDRRTVEALLDRYGIADLFPGERVVDKSAGADKSAHLSALSRGLGLPTTGMTFVDDKVNHLDATAPTGVRPALAAWGYNGPREHRLAARRGYAVCTLDDVEATLFDRDG